jgi:hypothetical protein
VPNCGPRYWFGPHKLGALDGTAGVVAGVGAALAGQAVQLLHALLSQAHRVFHDVATPFSVWFAHQLSHAGAGVAVGTPLSGHPQVLAQWSTIYV